MIRKLTNNLASKIMAVVIAVMIWVIVFSIADPVMTKEVKTTVIIDDSSLSDNDMVYTLDEDFYNDPSITFSIRGRTSIVNPLDGENFTAVADISNTGPYNAVPIVINYKSNRNDVEILRQANTSYMLSVTFEERVEKSYQVKYRLKSSLGSDYYISGKGFTSDPQFVEISSSESMLNKIAEVCIEIPSQLEVGPNNGTANLIVYDWNGDVRTDGNLTLSTETVDYQIEVLETREIALEVVPEGDVAAGYNVTDIKSNYDTVIIAGSPTDLAEYIATYGNVLEYKVDVTGESEFIQDTMDLAEYIEGTESEFEGIYFVVDPDRGEDYVYSITIDQKEVINETIQFRNVELIGANKDVYNYTLNTVSGSSAFSIRLAGTAAQLKLVEDGKVDIKTSVDLTEYTNNESTGTFTFPLTITIGNSNIDVVGKPTISIEITQKNQE